MLTAEAARVLNDEYFKLMFALLQGEARKQAIGYGSSELDFMRASASREGYEACLHLMSTLSQHIPEPPVLKEEYRDETTNEPHQWQTNQPEQQ